MVGARPRVKPASPSRAKITRPKGKLHVEDRLRIGRERRAVFGTPNRVDATGSAAPRPTARPQSIRLLFAGGCDAGR